MNTNGKSVLNVAGAGALALVLTTSAFAAPQRNHDSRGDWDRDRGNSQSSRGNSSYGTYGDNQRVNASGRVTSFSRENGGYRVYLDRGRESYWIPSSRMQNRGNDLRVGISIVLGGVFRGGRVDVDAVSWPDDHGRYDDRRYDSGRDSVRGVVERIDERRGVMLLRESASGRTVEVDMRDTRNDRRVDLNDLRRGDYVTLSGDWERGGRFEAERIESVSTGRR
jgi:hypothetical protein